MIKKIFKFISLTLIFCILMPIAVSAEESRTIRNITYEEWLAEQEGIDDSFEAAQSDMEPVKISVDKQESDASYIPAVYSEGKSGNKPLDSILREKGKYGLDREINLGSTAENMTSSRLKGTWNSALEPDSAGRGETFTPRYSFYYAYEYGD